MLAAHLSTLYPSAQLDSGLTCGCGYSSRSGHPCCSLALGNHCLPTDSSCSGCAGLGGVDWGGTGRWWVSALQPGLGLAVPCLWPGAPACPGWQLLAVGAWAVLPKVMHQLHRPSLWPGEDRHSLDLKAWLLWVGETPSQEWTGVKGTACPARGLCGLVYATPQLLH